MPTDKVSSESVVSDVTSPPLAESPECPPPDAAPSAARRIHDLPEDERPREKLLKHGPAALTDAELLALFFRTGTRGLSAIDLGRKLLEKYGSLTQLGRQHPKQLQMQKGLGPAKALDLLAAYELGRRLARESWTREPLDTPEAVCALIGPEMRAETHEVLKVVLLSNRMTLIAVEEISRGGVAETIAHPRDIMRHVMLHNATSFILVHNHPSGNPAPSGADFAVTRKVREAAQIMQVNFADHLIIGVPSEGCPGYYSFREAGVL